VVSFPSYWRTLPKWLKQLTLLVYYPVVLALALMVLTGEMFRHPTVVVVLMALFCIIAAIHTGRAFWNLGRAQKP
jgi:hypothetical protein